jgi:hypothetical protein
MDQESETKDRAQKGCRVIQENEDKYILRKIYIAEIIQKR